MNERKNNQADPNSMERNSTRPGDLPDSNEDAKKLETEETYIDLPDVKDIPGQEFVNTPPMGALGDTTISSDDEEGTNVFDRDESEDLRTGNRADVSGDEKRTLQNADYISTHDEDNLYRASMDNQDFQGERLNEKGFGEDRSGSDLDVPGSELDNRDEAVGEEDEENNDYSIGDDDEDNFTESPTEY